MKPTPSTDLIGQNLKRTLERIRNAAIKAGRNPADISLLAASKTRPAEAIRAAYAAGQGAFGENYLQEALEKINQLPALEIQWHFIGRIQGNKTRSLAENFHWIHGLASLKHAQRLDTQRPASLAPLNVCIQVNLSQEQTKGGIPEDELLPLAQSISDLSNIRLRGLMTMPDPDAPGNVQQATYKRCRHLLDQLKQQLGDRGSSLDTLSMGMSNDLEAAIAEGATLVRIGTAIFGHRP